MLQARPGGGGRAPPSGSTTGTYACAGAGAFFAAGGTGVAFFATGGIGVASFFITGRICCGRRRHQPVCSTEHGAH